MRERYGREGRDWKRARSEKSGRMVGGTFKSGVEEIDYMEVKIPRSGGAKSRGEITGGQITMSTKEHFSSTSSTKQFSSIKQQVSSNPQREPKSNQEECNVSLQQN